MVATTDLSQKNLGSCMSANRQKIGNTIPLSENNFWENVAWIKNCLMHKELKPLYRASQKKEVPTLISFQKTKIIFKLIIF